MVEVGKTSSLCPVCLKRVPARLDEEDLDVYLTKECPEHGLYRVIVWEGPPAFRSWKRPKIPTTPLMTYRLPF